MQRELAKTTPWPFLQSWPGPIAQGSGGSERKINPGGTGGPRGGGVMEDAGAQKSELQQPRTFLTPLPGGLKDPRTTSNNDRGYFQ